MRTLVIGGTGTVGREVVTGLREQGRYVRVLTSSIEKAERMQDGVEGVVGLLDDADTLPPAFDGIDAIFMATPLSMDETEMGLNAVRAAQDAGVRRMVYLTVHRLEDAPHIPHFQTKIPVKNALMESGIAWTLLEPNNFYQNDLMLRDAITGHGIYPQPIGDVGLNRVDTRDIGDAAVIALTEDGHEGRAYPLVGPASLTGEDVARLWSEGLGRDVQYGGNNLDAWVARAKLVMPAWLVHDLRTMYQYFQEEGLLATDDELEQQYRILGRPPRRFEDFVSETAAQWTA